MNFTSNGVRGKPYHLPAAPQLSAAAAAVRPCQPCSRAMTSSRPVIVKAIFSAFSLASAPLLTKNTLSNGSCENFTSRSAARRRTSIGTALLWKLTVWAWCVSAWIQPWWP